MKRGIACLCIAAWLIATGAAVDAQPKDVFKLRDVAWLAGAWRSPVGEKVIAEEHWSTREEGAMIGMFRLVNPGKSQLYEFLLMEETPDGVFMRLRHFKAGTAEVEKEPIRLKLVRASASEAVFENPDSDKPKRITYHSQKTEEMTVIVESTRDGKKAIFTLKMERMKK